MAWGTAPARTSEILTRPAKTESPAASPEVKPSGRSPLDARFHDAPLAALQGGAEPPTVAQVSQSMHGWPQLAPCSSTIRWSSPFVLPDAGAPSISAPVGMG